MSETNNFDWSKSETHRVGSRNGKPVVSAGKSGGIHFNSAFVRKNIKGAKYVRAHIIVEEDRAILGFRFLEEKEENTFTLAFNKNIGSAAFSGRSIFNKIEVDTREVGPLRFDYNIQKFNDGGDIFVIEVPLGKEEKEIDEN